MQDWIEKVAKVPVDDTKETPDACIIELGGTVGDIESAPFIESMRQLRRRAGKNNFLHIHVSLIPVVNGEQKTKPTQQSIKDVRSAGLSPDLIACRCETVLEKHTTDKTAMYCQVEPEQVLAVHDMPSTYRVPVHLKEQGLLASLKEVLQLNALQIPPAYQKSGAMTWQKWNDITALNIQPPASVRIALVGKYVSLHDSYLSVVKSLEHACMACERRLELLWVDASLLEPAALDEMPSDYHKAWHDVTTANGILVPGGFGHRGTEGMIAAAHHARTRDIPYLGICLGMQLAVTEYARNVCGMTGATSEEFDKQASINTIIFMPEGDRERMGGTQRLGIRDTHFQIGSEWSKLRQLYGNSLSKRVFVNGHSSNGSPSPPLSATTDKTAPIILERHRHRYEVNPELIEELSAKVLTFVGKDDKGERMEVIELKDHPWYVGVQFHPEYLSRVLEPSKPYLGFVAASCGGLDSMLAKLKGAKALDAENGTHAEGLPVNGVEELSF